MLTAMRYIPTRTLRFSRASASRIILYIHADLSGLGSSLIRFIAELNIYSIIPCLALRGIATSIARSPSLRAKILLRKWSAIE